MRNSTTFYGAIVLGIIALAVGVYLFATATPPAPHHISAPAAVVVGAILLIAGIVGLFAVGRRSTR